MRFDKSAVIAAWAVTFAIARPFKHLVGEVEDALANLGVDVTTIPQLNGSFTGSACERACGALDYLYGSERVLSENIPAYQNATESYWSAQQQEVKPTCIFIPSIDTDVSTVVLLTQLTECPFAAKSGGHAAFAGASSSQGGISILFRDLNEVSLNDDKSIASIGPGNKWGQVYKALEPHGLAVVGGRLSDIGVGGLTTGGGISYYSNEYGWALDNVESFEVVSAPDGNILRASETERPDLYWALRGGGNNVGLVTKFNLHTIPSPPLRGTTRVFSEDQFSNVLDAFVDVARNARADKNAQQYVVFAHTGGMNIASAELTYTKDVSDPAVFRNYRSIPAISDTSSTRNLSDYCSGIGAGDQNGQRQIFWNRTFKLNDEFAKWVVEHFFSVVARVTDVPGALPMLVFQVITEPMLEMMSRAGGNALGLDASSGPILMIHILSKWNNTSDDDTITGFVDDFFTNVAAEAKARGLNNDFIYMNYASQFQDVISSYGEDNKARLQQIASKFDHSGVYQTLQPGYFKLAGAPVQGTIES
ncbi:FAD-binding oxidoreductase [Aspergillus lucknowensis]|uniref:FAD-binding PCMH-type domain-containing protein n=1 Tax=Aspergillus lucknowensis TaxID=176173 RepID=A0ABR4LLZ3_9EURO